MVSSVQVIESSTMYETQVGDICEYDNDLKEQIGKEDCILTKNKIGWNRTMCQQNYTDHKNSTPFV